MGLINITIWLKEGGANRSVTQRCHGWSASLKKEFFIALLGEGLVAILLDAVTRHSGNEMEKEPHGQWLESGVDLNMSTH